MEHSFTWFSTFAHGDWDPVATSAFVVLLLLVFGLRVRKSLANTEQALLADEGVSARSVGEVFVEAIVGLARSAIPEHTERYVPLLASFFAFILVANVLGLVPGFAPATS